MTKFIQMKLQSNNSYLIIRLLFIILLCSSLSGLIISVCKTYLNPDIEKYFFLFFVLILILVTIIIKHAIRIDSKILYIKNIYGLVLHKISLDDIRTHKIFFKPAGPKNLLTFFGKKYDRNITIIIHLDSRKIKFNGHLLSDDGLEAFKRKIRK